MSLIKISAVSYLNSKPFIYGIEKSGLMSNYKLELDIPSVCAEKFLQKKVDIGLVPVAIIPQLKEYYFISDYCIGAEKSVGSVMLYSTVPLQQITKIYLDYQSRTSVILARILAKNYWKINPEWLNGILGYENKIKETVAAVVIGDRTFELKKKFPYSYDLAEEWNNYTKLPFVFALWIANKKLPQEFLISFNNALKFGIANIDAVVKENSDFKINSKEYFTQRISFSFDNKKRKALERFLEEMKKL